MKKSTLTFSFILGLLLTSMTSMAQAITTVGIIGSATALGWDNSTPMRLVTPSNPNQWTITLPLTVGEVKFRANNAWDINWGDTAFPAGTGTQGGPNIPIATASTYTVMFNSSTGAYQFTAGAMSNKSASKNAALSLSLAPNPASGTLNVSYKLPAAGTATIAVQNLLGQSVREFSSVRQAAGLQEQKVSLQGIAPGIYLVQVQTGNEMQTSRLVVE